MVLGSDGQLLRVTGVAGRAAGLLPGDVICGVGLEADGSDVVPVAGRAAILTALRSVGPGVEVQLRVQVRAHTLLCALPGSRLRWIHLPGRQRYIRSL